MIVNLCIVFAQNSMYATSASTTGGNTNNSYVWLYLKIRIILHKLQLQDIYILKPDLLIKLTRHVHCTLISNMICPRLAKRIVCYKEGRDQGTLRIILSRAGFLNKCVKLIIK